MKTIRVLVLQLLLASVHVFTPVSSDGTESSEMPTQPKVATEPAATTTTTKSTVATSPSKATPNTENGTSISSQITPVMTTPSTLTPAPPDNKTSSTAAPAVDKTSNETLKNDTVHPRSHRPSNPENQTFNETQGPDDSIEIPNTGKNTTTPAPGITEKPKTGKDTTTSTSVVTEDKQENVNKKASGPETGAEKNEAKPNPPPKSDKKLWWILLPVVLLGIAAAIILKFKCKKVHDHTETIDIGTENASFQSRPESTKDGVMLLGVKSSGGEENAPAR